jgi:hypothetical protein
MNDERFELYSATTFTLPTSPNPTVALPMPTPLPSSTVSSVRTKFDVAFTALVVVCLGALL